MWSTFLLNVNSSFNLWENSFCFEDMSELLQDPGNLGTLLRSALAFKWVRLHFSSSWFILLWTFWCHSSNVHSICSNSEWCVLACWVLWPIQLPIVGGNWVHLEAFRDHYQAKMFAGHPHCIDPLCLALGSEGKGISEKIKMTWELVSIPFSPNFESLNVSVAGGIFMFMMQTDLQGFWRRRNFHLKCCKMIMI